MALAREVVSSVCRPQPRRAKLRNHARRNNRRLTDVANDVINGRLVAGSRGRSSCPTKTPASADVMEPLDR